MTRTFDLIVIGSGSAAGSVASRCRAAGWTVAMIDKRLLGAHLFGPHAEEAINLFAMAMRAGMSAAQFKQMLWAYPTHASDTSYMV